MIESQLSSLTLLKIFSQIKKKMGPTNISTTRKMTKMNLTNAVLVPEETYSEQL